MTFHHLTAGLRLSWIIFAISLFITPSYATNIREEVIEHMITPCLTTRYYATLTYKERKIVSLEQYIAVELLSVAAEDVMQTVIDQVTGQPQELRRLFYAMSVRDCHDAFDLS